MIEEKIELSIPTYNRSKYLDNTLKYLLNSPFKDCKITIRDNASTDNTPKICDKYSKLFKNLKIIRNKHNIGANANILRCYEDAEAPYVWVVADNDLLNFDDCKDLLNAIESEKYDLIICGSGNYAYLDTDDPSFDDNKLVEFMKDNIKKEKYLENNATELVTVLKKYYFETLSFIPDTIYRTSFIDSYCLMKGYDYISKSHPHFPLYVKAIHSNSLTYKTKNDVVLMQKNPDDWEIGSINYYHRRLSCALLVEDKELRNYASQLFRGGLIYNLLAHIVVGKARNEEHLRENIIDLIAAVYKLKGWFMGFFYSILILLFYCIPKILCDHAYKKLGSEIVD